MQNSEYKMLKEPLVFFLGIGLIACLMFFCMAEGLSIGNKLAARNGFLESGGQVYRVIPADVVAKGEK